MFGKDKGKKYTPTEIDALTEAVRAEYESELKDKAAEIAILKEENNGLRLAISEFKDREDAVKFAVIEAEKQAAEIIKNAERSYEAEMERLKLFSLKWNAYFRYLYKTYPDYAVSAKVRAIDEELMKAFSTDMRPVELISSLYDEIENEVAASSVNSVPFDPRKQIEKYIAGENGFNMEEVLFPKQDLNLEEICKELGLMDSK